MTKEYVFELLDKAINHIDPNFCNEDCVSMFTDPLRDAVLPFQWSLESGISKAVLLIKGEPYVIKLPFCAMYDEDSYEDLSYEWREAVDDAVATELAKRGDPNYIFTPEELRAIEQSVTDICNPDDMADEFYLELEGATNINLPELQDAPDWDYCNLECAIYNRAVEQGLGAYFAEEGLLGILQCGHPVYYQQRCTPFYQLQMDHNSAEYQRKSRKGRSTCQENEIYCFNSVWIADFLECYGLEEFKRLNAFLNEMEIGDLREANIGYLDGAPILFDYSGFRHWD